MAQKPERRFKVVAENRKARFNYEIGDSYEAGIALTGSEVKSLRSGKATIAESYADAKGGDIWLINANIPEYLQAGPFNNHAPKRPRRLLLHRREIDQAIGKVQRDGYTLVPTALYWKGNKVKAELALARGKQTHDKREVEKERDWNREKQRLLRRNNKDA